MGLLLISTTTPTGLTSLPHAPLAEASEWVQRWSHLVPAGGTVLDVACGFGRHLRWFHYRNHPVVGVDRSSTAIESVAHLGEMVVADIETGPWPFVTPGTTETGLRQFDAVVVCNYLWRPLFPHITNSVAPGGVLIYETFATGNETVGKPSRPDFLLNTGELLHVCRSFKTVAYEDVYLENPARFVQRIVAIKPKIDR
jgi:SAM-dependent methyltransferase